MLATAANHLSPSDIWRRKDEKTKERSASELLRDWRTSKGIGEMKGSGEMRGVLGSWRVRRQEQPSRADEGGVYGGCMPAEWKLQALYKRLKIDTNNFSTWLVESTYPCSESQLCNESLPPYVTLCREQAKDHPKYDILVNNNKDLARKIENVPSGILALLERLIIDRTEYSHWMSRKSTDQLSKLSHERHIYYIQVLKEVKTILSERKESETTKPPQADSFNKETTAKVSARPEVPRSTKRKGSSTGMDNVDRKKAAKHSTTTQSQQQEEWRQVVADTCDKMAEKECAAAANKPMSYAAALRVKIAA